MMTDMIDRVRFSSAEDRGGCGSGVAVATGGGVVPVAGGVWLGVGDGRSVGGARARPGLPQAARSVCGGCRGSNARFRSSLRWLDALEASMTGTGAYDAEALKAREADYRNHVRDEVF